MMSIGVGLYVNHSVEAVELYCEAFELELGYHVRNEDGSFFHSELYSGEQEMLAVVESHEPVTKINPVHLGFTFDDTIKLKRAFELLSKDGRVLMDICTLPWSPCAAEVMDKYGVIWYLSVPQHRPPEDFTPDDCKE